MSCISTLPVTEHLVVPLKLAVQAPADASSDPLPGANSSNSSDDDAISSLNGDGSSSSPVGDQSSNGHHRLLTSSDNSSELNGRGDHHQLVLYWTSGFGSPPCMRLMIAMAEKQLLDRAVKIHINLMTGENRTPELETLNKRMQVPILKVGHNIVICESLASCFFIEDEYKDCGNMLLPHNAMLKAKVLQRCLEALNLETKTRDIVLPLQNWLPPDLRQPVDPMRIKMAKESLINELNFWEKNLADNVMSEFLVGGSFSMADAVFFPSLAWLVKYGLDLNCRSWENLKRYYETLKNRPSILASWPPTWSMKSPLGELKMFDDITPPAASAQTTM